MWIFYGALYVHLGLQVTHILVMLEAACSAWAKDAQCHSCALAHAQQAVCGCQGAGVTPYSRRADGRAVMRSSLRGKPYPTLPTPLAFRTY